MDTIQITLEQYMVLFNVQTKLLGEFLSLKDTVSYLSQELNQIKEEVKTQQETTSKRTRK